MRIKKWEQYIFSQNNTPRENNFKKSFNRYEQALEKIKKNKNPHNIEIIQKIRKELEKCFLPEEGNRNILKKSSVKDKRIWSGQDSVVYEFQNISWWIYKEWQKADKENLEYMIKKYKVLKKYLWKYIPDSYFVVWEAYEKFFKRWFKNWHYLQSKLITVQRKVKWKDLSKMSKEEKLNTEFLGKLEKAHRKYILLKIFIEQLQEDLQINDKFDVKLDLGNLSNMERWNFQNIDFIEKNLNSPNIMFDEKNIYFIDLWFGFWSEEKKLVFKELMKEENFKKWQQIIKNFNIIE